MKISSDRMICVFVSLLTLMLAFLLTPCVALSQSKGSSTTSSSSTSGGGGNGGGGSPSSNGQQNAPSATRIEASIIAYEASDKIAAHIANQLQNKKVIVYDIQTFAALQAYEAYSATVSTLEIAFQVGGLPPDQKSLSPALDAAQTVISTLATLRSSTEYGIATVNPQTDVIVAQVAHKLAAPSVIVPKFLLLSNADLDSPNLEEVEDHNCSDIDLGVPGQLACLAKVRENNRTNPNFTAIDKMFQTFLGTVIGNSSVAKSPQQSAADVSGSTNQMDTGNQSQNQNQSQATSVLPLIIQGRRLKTVLTKASTTTPVRLLVVEATEAGGSYRILHNFWVEVFWRTPTPAFNGGSIVTYFVIDPQTSMVEQSETLSYMYNFSKFKKMKSAPNPACSWEPATQKCPK